MFVARAQYIANHSWTLNNQEVPLGRFIPYYERPLRTTTSDTYAVMQGSGSSPGGQADCVSQVHGSIDFIFQKTSVSPV